MAAAERIGVYDPLSSFGSDSPAPGVRLREARPMTAMQRSFGVELFWKLHKLAYRISGGRVGGRLVNLPVLLLTTHGRRSGRPRRVALTSLPWEGRHVVIASCLGEPRHPAWWLNLEAQPEATVQLGSRRFRVKAREALGEEREAIWRALVARQPDYDVYASRTQRRIPVVVLDPQP